MIWNELELVEMSWNDYYEFDYTIDRINGQWSMVNAQWSMLNAQWSMLNVLRPVGTIYR